jgi:phosphatidylserine/phosphatidylglycerophosphate/cardiolipin synthase-like enzyme
VILGNAVRLLPSKPIRRFLLFALGVLLFVGVNAWRHHSALPTTAPPLPQDPLIQVYFNHSRAASYREPYRTQSRYGDDLEKIVIETIASAQSSIDLAVQELALPHVAIALRDKYQAGIAVRVIVENDYNFLWSQVDPAQINLAEDRDRYKYEEFFSLADQDGDGQLSQSEVEQTDSLLILQQAGIPILDDTADGSKGSGLMHHKFMVVDGQIVLTGSVNYSLSEVHGDYLAPNTEGNANHLLKIHSPALAQIFTQEFNLMWGHGSGTGTPLFGLQKTYRPPQQITLAPNSQITVQFSPTSKSQPWSNSVNGLIGTVLNSATRTVDLALFVFSDQALSDILEARHQQGVQVRGLIDSGFAYRDYSEALDMLGTALPNRQCRYEEGNRPWRSPIATIGTPQLPKGDLLHHKFAIVDQHLVITGSQNWSAAANYENDENLLVINNSTVAAHFQREFDRLYQTANLGISSALQSKMQSQRVQCGL